MKGLNKEDTKLFECFAKHKVKCKCSHTVVMMSTERLVCSHCGEWIYKSPEIEFKYKMMKALKERDKNEGIQNQDRKS